MKYITPIYFRPTEEQAKILREQADAESRKISDHLRFIVSLGLKSYAETHTAPTGKRGGKSAKASVAA